MSYCGHVACGDRVITPLGTLSVETEPRLSGLNSMRSYLIIIHCSNLCNNLVTTGRQVASISKGCTGAGGP